MAFSISSVPSLNPRLQSRNLNICQFRSSNRTSLRCNSISSSLGGDSGDGNLDLRIGSPIVVVEAPTTLKTAESMTCLKVNAGLVKPGDVGRIVARKPKDVWAVRLTIGTYLLDGKYFKPLVLDEE